MRATTLTTHLAAYAATAGLVLAGSILAVTPAQADPVGPQPASEAGDWLAGQLTGGLMHNPNYGGFDDFGLSIDTALALDTVGGHDTDVQSVSDAVASRIEEYITGGDFAPDDIYSGAVAKSAVLATTAGSDPRAFGGVDLIDTLESRVAASAPITGRVQDKSSTDYANVLGQSFASRALAEAGSAKTGGVTGFLLKQQCRSGYFRLNFSAPGAANQSCVEGADAPDADATALAVVLLGGQDADPVVAAARDKAQAWLVGQQRCNGSFGGGTTTEGANANSTGLAAWALQGTPAARQAATWLRAHQATDGDAGNALASEQGAIAYDDAGHAAGRADGITDSTADQWRRATAQAAPGLLGFSDAATPDLQLTGPRGYRKAGTKDVLTASGAEEGTVLCTTGPGTSQTGVATDTGLNSTVTLPAGTRTRVYTVRDAYGHQATTAVKVLGQAKLRVTKSRHRVKRGRTMTATVNWLAPHEWARIVYKGRLVRSGHATADGTFSATFRVGKKRGKKRIVGYGHFIDTRRGATVIRVVR